MQKLFAALALSLVVVGASLAERLPENRENADFVLVGRVNAVYARDTVGYRDYIIEVKVDSVTKGKGVVKQGDTFRAYCYKIKPGTTFNPDFDTAGHKTVPVEGQRVRLYVNRVNGQNEGVYPDWVDVVRPSWPKRPKRPMRPGK